MVKLSPNDLTCVKAHIALDPNSPSGLIWTAPTSRRTKAGTPAGYDYGAGYYKIQLHGKRYRASHLVLYLNGIFPSEGQSEVDHIDRNPWNNLVGNLRWTNRSGNMSNRRVLGAVAYRYVHKSRNKFAAQYVCPRTKRLVFVGRHKSAYAAHLAAVAHRLEHHWIER